MYSNKTCFKYTATGHNVVTLYTTWLEYLFSVPSPASALNHCTHGKFQINIVEQKIKLD